MGLPLISPHQASEVERLKGFGRTTSQIEKFFGLSYGALRHGYEIDPSFEAARVRSQEITAEVREQFRREMAAIKADLRRNSRVDGWRPEGDCVRSKPGTRGGHPGRPKLGETR